MTPSPTAAPPIPQPAQQDPDMGEDQPLTHALPSLGTPDDFDETIGAMTAILPQITLDLTYVPYPKFQKDTKGEPVTLRVSPNLAQMIDRIIHTRATPYNTKSEFFRDAAYYLTKALVTMFHIQDARLTAILNGAEVAAQAEFMAGHDKQVLQAEHHLTDYLLSVLARGRLGEAVRAIEKEEHTARQIPIDWWRADYLRTIHRNPVVQAVRALSATSVSKSS